MSVSSTPELYPSIARKSAVVIMSYNPPQTLSVKRKRTEAPVSSLIEAESDGGGKRQRSNTYAWQLEKPGAHDASVTTEALGVQSTRRQFHVSHAKGNRVLIETRQTRHVEVINKPVSTPPRPLGFPEKIPFAIISGAHRLRKRPGRGTGLLVAKADTTVLKSDRKEPSAAELLEYEQWSRDIEEDDSIKSTVASRPLAFQPRVPALRYKDRHPEKAVQLEHHDSDAMDVDDFVYDTYVRKLVEPDADGKLPNPEGTVGIIVLKDEDEDWWNGEESSDDELATDEEDENAEDYYANDYPEDELDSDDEFDRNLYQSKYRCGSEDENDNEDDEEGFRSDEDVDAEHFRRAVPSIQSGGYWGRIGE